MISHPPGASWFTPEKHQKTTKLGEIHHMIYLLQKSTRKPPNSEKSTIWSMPTRKPTIKKGTYLRRELCTTSENLDKWDSTCTSTSAEAASATDSRLLPLLEPQDLQVHKTMSQRRVHAVSPSSRPSWFTSTHNDRTTSGLEKGHAFFVEKNIVKMPYAKIRGTRLDVPADRKKRLETRLETRKKEGSKATSWSHRFNCGSRFVSTARCGRVDPLRRPELRLIYSRTNLRRQVRRASLWKMD